MFSEKDNDECIILFSADLKAINNQTTSDKYTYSAPDKIAVLSKFNWIEHFNHKDGSRDYYYYKSKVVHKDVLKEIKNDLSKVEKLYVFA